MTKRHVRRRDFSAHWAFSEQTRRFFRIGRWLLEWPLLPAPVFLFVLALLAFAGARGRWIPAVILGSFMLGDYLVLLLLPRVGKSYGSPQPATLVLAIPRALFMLVPWQPAIAWNLQLVGTILVVYGTWIEPHKIGVTRERLVSSKLPPRRPLRVLHFGDLHVERITGRERQLVSLVASLKPDLALFSGDFLNVSYTRDPEAWSACRWVLERLSAPHGVFVVAGSSASDPLDVLPGLLEGLPLRWLREERVTIDHDGVELDLIGVTCTHRPFDDRRPLEGLVRRDRFTIFLYHTPDLAPDAAELGVDLMLSGHTHGGQVRIPGYGALFTSSLYGKAFEMGRYEQAGLTLYVTRGLGLEGSGMPRIRVGCPPEIVLWDLEGMG